MDRDQELEDLKKLITLIEESEMTEEVVNWLKEISSPNDENKLIENLIKSFIEHLADIEYANSILRTLK